MATDGATQEEISKIRESQKEIQKAIRIRKKTQIWGSNRLQLHEIEECQRQISVDEMKSLTLNLVKLKGQMDVLQKVKNACLSDDHIETFLRVSNSLTVVVGKLCSKDASAQLEAAACISNLATGSHKSTKKVAEAAGAYLITYLMGNSRFLQCQCAWAVGNIANECESCFSVVKAQGILPALESLLKSPYPEVIESVIFALTASSQYPCPEMNDLIQRNVEVTLWSILNRNDISVLTKAEVLFIISDISLQILELSSESRVISLTESLLEQLEKASENGNINTLLCTPILQSLGNLTTTSSTLSNLILYSRSFQNCFIPVLASSHGHSSCEIFCLLHNTLVNTDANEHSTTWQGIVKHIVPFISPLNSNILQVLYFLCTLKSKWSSFETEMNNELSSSLSVLGNCGNDGIDTAMRTLESISYHVPM